MRLTTFIFAAVAATIAFALPARAAESTAVRALLIMASNNKAPADPKLAPFEAELQRNLPESSFRFVREGSASVTDNSSATIALGAGDSVEVEAKKSAEGIHVKVRWMKGGAAFMGGTFTQQPGVPIVLLRRPANDSDAPIVLVIAR